MNAHPGDPGQARSIGSVAEEAARIIGLFSNGMDPESVQAAGARAAGTPRPASVACPTCGQVPRESGTTDSVCRVCPVCRVLAIVRSINPDTLERVADVVELLSDGLRSYASNRRDCAARDAAVQEARAAEAAAAAGVRDVTAEFFPPEHDGYLLDDDADDYPGADGAAFPPDDELLDLEGSHDRWADTDPGGPAPGHGPCTCRPHDGATS